MSSRIASLNSIDEAAELIAKTACVSRKLRAMQKSALVEGALLGGLIGGIKSPSNNDRLSSVGHGAVRGIGAEAGGFGGALLGQGAGVAIDHALPALIRLLSRGKIRPSAHTSDLGPAMVMGTLGGLGYGGYKGYQWTDRAMGKAPWQKESGVLDTITDAIKENPGTASTLAGAGIGAGVGGLSEVMSGKKKKHFLRNALTGALGGAAVGGGGYLASKALPGAIKMPDSSSALKLKPEAASPENLQKIEELRQRTPLGTAASAIKDTVMEYPKRHPVLGSILGLDVASHALGRAGRIAGVDTASFDPKVMGPGADKVQAAQKVNKSTAIPEEVLNRISTSGGGTPGGAPTTEAWSNIQRDISGRANHGIGSTIETIGKEDARVPFDITAKTVKDISRAGEGKLPMGGLNTLSGLYGKLRTMITGGAAHDPDIGTGWRYRPGGLHDMVRSPATRFNPVTDLHPTIGTRLARGAEETGNFLSRNNAGTLPGMLGRTALYAGVPAVQALWRAGSQDADKQKRLLQLIKQLSEPK